jgi:hypothetical protein
MQLLDLTPQQQADAWRDLREHVRHHSDVLSVTGLGARLGWAKSSAKALLNPTDKSPRTAATLERLAQAQHLLAGYGYWAPVPAYATPVIGPPTSGRALELELELRKLEAEYLRLAPDHIQARAAAAAFPQEFQYRDRADDIGRHLQSLLKDIAAARFVLTHLPL